MNKTKNIVVCNFGEIGYDFTQNYTLSIVTSETIY